MEEHKTDGTPCWCNPKVIHVDGVALTKKQEAKEPNKYTMKEFWDSLSWDCNDADEQPDKYLHIISDIDGSEQKLLIENIKPGAGNH